MPQNIRTGGVTAGLRFPELVDVDPRDFAANPAPVLKALMTYPAFRLALAQNQDETFELGTKKATGPARRQVEVMKAEDAVLNQPAENVLSRETTDASIANQQLERTKKQQEDVELKANAEVDARIAEQDRMNKLLDAQSKQQRDAEDRALKAQAVNDMTAYRTAMAEAATLRAQNDTLKAQVAQFNAQTTRDKANKPRPLVKLGEWRIKKDGKEMLQIVSRDPETNEIIPEVTDLPEGAEFIKPSNPMDFLAKLQGAPTPTVTPPAPAPSPTPAAAEPATPQIPTLTPEVARSPATPPGYFIGTDGLTYLKQPNGKIVKAQ